ncbi:MAG: hypothetical protein KDD66_17050 [Bdellovibrionales bacterium]|nr:hypothetical protein [Bdellovibrionales bacterium]
MEDLISASDGASLVGISEETLLEYSTKGFLKTSEIDGQLRFSAAELEVLFGVSDPKSGSKRSESLSKDNSTLRGQIEVLSVEDSADRSPEQRMIKLEADNQRLLDENLHLKEERAWLRERLEKLETRSERDQMLMLSELETIRGLARESRKSSGGFLSRLPWFGRGEKQS